TVDPKAVAVPSPKSVKQYDVVTCSCGSSAQAPNFHGQSPLQLLRDGLMRLGLMVPDGASNWLGVTKAYTQSGHPIGVMGPQVGYWSPEILMEMDIHAPGVDARGAFTLERTTFGAELDSAIAFVYLNGDRVTDPATFQKALSYLTGSFNWLYVDDQHVAYFHSGLYPIRAAGVDPDLPSWGTGKWDWKGFSADTTGLNQKLDALPTAQHPQEVDPPKGWIASWNNKPARSWSAADSKWAYGD